MLTACGGSGPVTASATPAPPPAAPTAEAPPADAPPADAPAPPAGAPSDRPLARVFPDATDPACLPADDTVRTSTGAVPTEAYVCDYSAVAPSARLVLAEWPDAAAAQAWFQDTVDLGPRIEEFDQWELGGVEQGPLHTAQQSDDGPVFSTGIYEGLPYGWEIQTATLDESNAVFSAAGRGFRPAAQIDG